MYLDSTQLLKISVVIWTGIRTKTNTCWGTRTPKI